MKLTELTDHWWCIVYQMFGEKVHENRLNKRDKKQNIQSSFITTG